MFALVLHCAGCALLHRAVFTSASVPWLATILCAADTSPSLQSYINVPVLNVVELMSQVIAAIGHDDGDGDGNGDGDGDGDVRKYVCSMASFWWKVVWLANW